MARASTIRTSLHVQLPTWTLLETHEHLSNVNGPARLGETPCTWEPIWSAWGPLWTVRLRFTFSDTGTLPVLLCRTQQSGFGHEEGAL